MVNGCFVPALMMVPAGSSVIRQRRVVCDCGAGPTLSNGLSEAGGASGYSGRITSLPALRRGSTYARPGAPRTEAAAGPGKRRRRLFLSFPTFDIGREARRVERHISGKCRTFRAIHALEALEACIEGCLSPARESQQNDFPRVDTWMRGEYT